MSTNNELEKAPRRPRTEGETADQIYRILGKIENRLNEKEAVIGETKAGFTEAVLTNSEGEVTGHALIVGESALNREVSVIRYGAGEHNDGEFGISSRGGMFRPQRDQLTAITEEPVGKFNLNTTVASRDVSLQQRLIGPASINAERRDQGTEYSGSGGLVATASDPLEMPMDDIRDTAAKTLRAYKAAVDAVDPVDYQ